MRSEKAKKLLRRENNFMSIWPIIASICLVLLKSAMKLYIINKPDLIDHAKAASALPVDVAFLIVGLFIKHLACQSVNVEQVSCFLLMYLMLSILVTALWRCSDSAIENSLFKRFGLIFPLNLAVSGTGFYLALSFLK